MGKLTNVTANGHALYKRLLLTRTLLSSRLLIIAVTELWCEIEADMTVIKGKLALQ